MVKRAVVELIAQADFEAATQFTSDVSADLLDIPFEIFTGIINLFAKYQSQGVLCLEHPLYGVAALLGPLMYTAMFQGAMPERDLPSLDLESHVACFLEGRYVKR